MAQQIINLAFKGGGVKGIAYAGAYKALYEAGLMKNVKRIAGSSAGAVFAAIACLGYDPDEVKDIIGGTSFASFMDKKDILRIMSKYGIYKGDAFLSWMEKQVAGSKLDKKLTKTATFRDLKNAGGRDLHVFSADISTHQLIEFSYETSPDVVVAEAVRASMSIPLFFEAWRFRNNNPNNHYYVDGGMVYNYPVTAFDHYGDGRDATLGFYLLNFNAPPLSERVRNNPVKPADIGNGHIVKYIKNTMVTMLDAQEINLDLHPDDEKRTLKIDDFGISPTDFNITKVEEDKLFKSGYDLAKKYIQEHQLA